MEEAEFVPADKRLRRAVVAAILLLLAAGLAGLSMLGRLFRGIENLQDAELRAAIDQAVRATTIVAWIGGVSLIGCGLWLFWLGSRITRASRYPPPGMKVLRATRIRVDAAARTMANLAFLGALACTLAGTFGMWHLWRVAVRILGEIGP